MIRPRDIKVGTSGWKFDDWAGTFYPLRVPRTKWLEYYASRFPIGEINSTYYRIAGTATYEAIDKRTPGSFEIYAKVHADVTHSDMHPAESMRHLMSVLRPLRDSGKLRGLLAQFPNKFSYSLSNLDRVKAVAGMCNELQLCTEFRHTSWEREDALAAIRDCGITWVSPDEPELPGLVSKTLRATAGLLYVRMHGRNASAWYNRNAGDRYDYNYSDEQLKTLGTSLLEFNGDATTAVVFFNNCYHGQAASNGHWFKDWLNQMSVDVSSGSSTNGFTVPLD